MNVKSSTLVAVAACLQLQTVTLHALSASYVKNARLSTSALILTDTSSPHYFGPSINGTTTDQNAVLNYGGHQFAVYYNSSRKLCLARRSLSNSSWKTIVFSYTTSTLEDSHRTASIGICPIDDSVHVAFDHHASPLRYIGTGTGGALVSNANWNSSLFFAERDYLKAGEHPTTVTYPRFVVAKDDKLLLFRRQWGSSNGIEVFNEYRGNGEWSGQIGCTSNQGDFNGSDKRSTYVNPIIYHNGNIHMSWVWREAETSDSAHTHDLQYAWSNDNSRTWYNKDNLLVGTSGAGSFKMSIDSDVKVDDIDEDRNMSNQFAQAVDSHGNPHIVLRYRDQPGGTQRYYHYVKNSSNQFSVFEIPLPAGRRPKLYCDSFNTLWLVCNVNNYLYVYAAKESTGWDNWSVAYDGSSGWQFMNDFAIYAEGSSLWVMCQRTGSGNASSLHLYELSLSQ